MLRSLVLIFFLSLLVPIASFAACTTGQTTCATDTINDALIAAAIRDPTVQLRVFEQWIGFCFSNVWNEAASTAGNLARVSYCNQIAAGGVDKSILVADIMNSTIQSEILGSCTIPVGTLGSAAGCMVDVDVSNSIATLMQVTVSTASTTATAASGSTLLTVASATGINAGMNVYGAGIPGAGIPGGGTIVTNVSGTNVAISQATTAALSATPVLFTVSVGLP